MVFWSCPDKLDIVHRYEMSREVWWVLCEIWVVTREGWGVVWGSLGGASPALPGSSAFHFPAAVCFSVSWAGPLHFRWHQWHDGDQASFVMDLKLSPVWVWFCNEESILPVQSDDVVNINVFSITRPGLHWDWRDSIQDPLQWVLCCDRINWLLWNLSSPLRSNHYNQFGPQQPHSPPLSPGFNVERYVTLETVLCLHCLAL